MVPCFIAYLLLSFMHLSGFLALLLALYVSFVSCLCVYMCHYVYCISNWSICISICVFWSFIHVYFVGTGVVSFHYVLPIFFCDCPFADALFCALCSV